MRRKSGAGVAARRPPPLRRRLEEGPRAGLAARVSGRGQAPQARGPARPRGRRRGRGVRGVRPQRRAFGEARRRRARRRQGGRDVQGRVLCGREHDWRRAPAPHRRRRRRDDVPRHGRQDRRGRAQGQRRRGQEEAGRQKRANRDGRLRRRGRVRVPRGGRGARGVRPLQGPGLRRAHVEPEARVLQPRAVRADAGKVHVARRAVGARRGRGPRAYAGLRRRRLAAAALRYARARLARGHRHARGQRRRVQAEDAVGRSRSLRD
mmetsp:Transcript_24519/g.75638  ORF Transcript_24519/g.75638 Transcript_24519/m.75638 type:complete len:264 (+) Transcript_24519:640-1431(+)